MQKNKHIISPIKQRILQFIDYIGISRYEFYKKTNISRGTLDNMSGLTEENIAKFLAYYKNVNPTWLLTGEGPMLREEIQQEEAYKPPPEAIKPKKTEPTNTNTCPLCAEKERIIAEKERVIEKQEQIIKDKEKIIALLEAQLADYKAKEGAKCVENNTALPPELEKEKTKV